MAEASDTLGMIYQNLKDAGCDEKTTQGCMSMAKSGNLSGMLPILTRYRSTLLGKVRSGQKQIDCLDYLIHDNRKFAKRTFYCIQNSKRNDLGGKRDDEFQF